MAVRTTVLAQAVANTTLTVIFTCPAGKTAIIKDITSNKFGTPASVLTVTIRRAPNAYAIVHRAFPIQASVGHDQGFWVMQPGDELRVVTDGQTIGCWVSGALLVGVA